MEFIVKFVLPMLAIVLVAGIYIWFLNSRKADKSKCEIKQTCVLPKSAPVVPYFESILQTFYQALKQALPEKYIIYVNVPIEKLFEPSKRANLKMAGQYADYVIFTPSWMPILVIDLFDMSIVNLDRVNKIKNVSKEILRNSGIPVLDYQYTDNCDIGDLRRKIANVLNPLTMKD
ncbi:MAG: DUF2726 domain-containing protein [Clostridia bacterium]|nr:DUF2726 domain-containing protein [Clostridia bacterium]